VPHPPPLTRRRAARPWPADADFVIAAISFGQTVAFVPFRPLQNGGRSLVSRKLVAEFFGTAWLVLGGCGSAVLAAKFPEVGIGLVGVALAFGLTVLTGAYAVGHISGAHFNPAVTIGLATAGRFRFAEVPGYIIAQVLGAAAGAGILYAIASGAPGYSLGGFAANGYGEHSPGHYSLVAAAVSEFALTFFFLWVILGATARRSPAGFAGIPIGLALTLIHLVSIPVTNTSVNPARSTSQALFVQGWALDQLWLFWAAPIAGAVVAGLVGSWLDAEDPQSARAALSAAAE
jgi:aquaporin Z